jgi:hypothetical protein
MTIARQPLSIHVPANTIGAVFSVDNAATSFVRAMPSATQQSCKHASLIEEECFYVVHAAAI